jgi:8-oxo-dGTP pyrophosphatase MutT (NUDIX family)
MKNKQVAALPFRTTEKQLSILLITTRGKRRWSVPKGWPVQRKRAHRTAAVEAYEEAGLVGQVDPKAIGAFRHRKRKGKRKIMCDVKLFPLEVKKQCKQWPERGQRQAIWLPASEAAQLVHRAELRRLIQRFADEQTSGPSRSRSARS